MAVGLFCCAGVPLGAVDLQKKPRSIAASSTPNNSPQAQVAFEKSPGNAPHRDTIGLLSLRDTDEIRATLRSPAGRRVPLLACPAVPG
jgi:hypothetical protein